MARPEEIARQLIDRQLEEAGWIVQDARQMYISASPGVAIREFPLKTGSADYLFYLDGQAAGVIDAMPEGHSLTSVQIHAACQTRLVPRLGKNVP